MNCAYTINNKKISGMTASMVPGIFIASQLDGTIKDLVVKDPDNGRISMKYREDGTIDGFNAFINKLSNNSGKHRRSALKRMGGGGNPLSLNHLFPNISKSIKFKLNQPFYVISGIISGNTNKYSVMYKVYSLDVILGFTAYFEAMGKYVNYGFVYYVLRDKWTRVDIPVNIRFRLYDGMTKTDTDYIGGDPDDRVTPRSFYIKNLIFRKPNLSIFDKPKDISEEEMVKYSEEMDGIDELLKELYDNFHCVCKVKSNSPYGFTRKAFIDEIEADFKEACYDYSTIVAKQMVIKDRYSGTSSGIMRLQLPNNSVKHGLFEGVITHEHLSGKIGNMHIDFPIKLKGRKSVGNDKEGLLITNLYTATDKNGDTIKVEYYPGVYPDFLPTKIFNSLSLNGNGDIDDLDTYFIESFTAKYNTRDNTVCLSLVFNTQPVIEENSPVPYDTDQFIRVWPNMPNWRVSKTINYEDNLVIDYS